MKRARGLIAITFLALVCAPAAARADLTWTAPPERCLPPQTAPSQGCGQDLSPGGENSNDVHVATDAAGDAVAVWLEHDSATNVLTVEEARRPAGGDFGAKMPISAAEVQNQDSDAADPAVAMNARGDVIIIWDQFDHSLYNGLGARQLYYSWEPAGRAWAPIQIALPGAVSGDTNPQVGLDSAGDAVMVWLGESDDSSFRTLDSAYRPAGDNAQFSTRRRLTQCPICSNNPPNRPTYPAPPQLSVNAAGDALVTFVDTYNPQDIDADDRVDAVFLPAGGTAGWPDFGHETTLSTGTANGFLVHDPTAAIDAAGNGLVVFGQGQGQSDIEAAYRPKAQGTFNSAQTISTTQFNSVPQAAFGPSGDAFAVWVQVPDSPALSPEQVVAAYRPAGANTAFGTAVQLSTSTLQSDYPRVGVDGKGRPAALWVATDSGGDDTVQGSSRVAGPGTWAAPSNLSTAGDLRADTAGPPDFSVSSAGQAVGTWQRYDGSELIAQSGIGTPPESKPPPPPPPPPPPIPQAINAAAPFERSKAIVLTATVKGNATQLVWDFSGPNPKINAGIVDGHLERSVRLHPTTRELMVKVTAIGPGGSETYSRTFELPKPLSDSNSVQAQRAVDDLNAPPVFAVGDAQDLVGTGGAADHAAADGGASAHAAADTGCGKITVYSAAETISGCLRPANVLNNIPARERGFIAPLADQLGIDPSNAPLVQDAIQEMDGYVAQGTALVNDNWPVIPDGAAQLVSFAQTSQLTSSSASVEVAGLKFGASKNGFSMDLNPKLSDIPLGDLPKPPKLPSIGGFELTGDWHIDLQKRVATITASLKLPNWITTAGVSVQNSVTLKATPDRLILQDVSIGPISVNIGSLGVQNFKISYDDSQDEWTGQGKACVLPQACLDMVPPNGEIKIKHGQLEFAGASLDFPLPGIPLFPGVNLERIGFGFGLDPTRMTGNGRISVVRLVKLDGRMVIAFPSDRTPFFLKADEVGGGFPTRLYGTAFTRPTIGATAAVIVSIPEIGDLELGHGYFLYQYPSYVSVGGGISQTLFDFLRFSGDINGESNFNEGTINLHGDIQGCVNIDGWRCAGAVANISHAPNSGGGAGACLSIGPVNIGGGVQWAHPTDPIIWPFDGCKWSRFAVKVSTSSASSAAVTTRQTIKVVRGARSPAIQLFGQGAAPLVRVTGPGGQQLDSSAQGLALSPGGQIRIIGFRSAQESLTVVGLEHARPGIYTVTALPGSVPFIKVARATDLPAARARASVSGSGLRRILHYKVLSRPGQEVNFYDVAEGGSAKLIGRVRGGGSGALRFSPAPGRHRRQVVAQFVLQGLGAERLTVASFKPPAPRLGRPPRLRLHRHGRTLTVSWRRVAGAAGYEVAITSRTGLQRFISTRGTHVTFKRLARWLSGVVTVRALDSVRQSNVAKRSFKGTGSKPSVFHSLPHCKVTRRKISCPGYKFHHHARHHKPKPKPKHKHKH
jgi:hypothetical protein